MCGITGIIGCFSTNLLYNSLQKLQNRGYCGAGICTIEPSGFLISKYASDDKVLGLNKLSADLCMHSSNNIGIGHTRWATHGNKTDINTHPHISTNGKFVIVHNGTIGNYLEHKNFLLSVGYIFLSETDTEVIANLLDYHYNNISDVSKLIEHVVDLLEGTWCLLILCVDTPNTIYCIKNTMSLMLGLNENFSFAMIVSEKIGFDNQIKKYAPINNNSLYILHNNSEGINVFTKELINYSILSPSTFINIDGHAHWTIKEIMDQPNVIIATQQEFSLKQELDIYRNKIVECDHLLILGCGSSKYASCIGSTFFKSVCNFTTVQVFDGAELRTTDLPKNGKLLVIVVTQSGETRDLIRCLDIISGAFIIGIVNVHESTIAKNVNCVCYMEVGSEVGVCATKSFLASVVILNMISIWISKLHNITSSLIADYIFDLEQLANDLHIVVNEIEWDYTNFTYSNCYILGKGTNESVAYEGSLKLKELSYIHAEGSSSSSLKHGPFALLDSNFCVIIIAPSDEEYIKNMNIYEEVKSRCAPIIVLSDKFNSNIANQIIVPRNRTFSCLLFTVLIQKLAYYIAVNKGINPDTPRHLAKVVTVD